MSSKKKTLKAVPANTDWTNQIQNLQQDAVDLSSTDDLDASHDIDDTMHDDLEIILREEVQIWLSEYGAKLFSLGQDRWNAKQEKKNRKSSETLPTHSTPNKKRKVL